MSWRPVILAVALFASGVARAEDPRQNVQEVMREALLRYATLPSIPPRLPDRDTVVPGSAPGMRPGPRPTPPRGSPPRSPGGPTTPHGMHDGRGALAAHGAHDGHAAREQVRESMAHAAQSRAMTHGARDANAMRGEAAHRSSMGFGMGATPGMTGHQDGSVGNGGCEDGAEMWRTLNPHGGTMGDDGTSGGGHAPGGETNHMLNLASPISGAASRPAVGR